MNGDVFYGQMDGAYIGKFGRLCKENGDIYHGDFSDGRIHGHGKYSYANGDIYEGEFCENKIDGQGEFLYSKDAKKFRVRISASLFLIRCAKCHSAILL